MKVAKDYYAVLGVLPSVDKVALGAAYRALLKKYHPDVFPGPREKAEARTREIVEAYDTLRDLRKRHAYDAARTVRRPEAANIWPRGGANAWVGTVSARAFRDNPGASPNRPRDASERLARKSLWPVIVTGILGLLLAARLFYSGL